MHIEKSAIFRILPYLGPQTYSELCQASKVEDLTDELKGIIVLLQRPLLAVVQVSEHCEVISSLHCTVTLGYVLYWPKGH